MPVRIGKQHKGAIIAVQDTDGCLARHGGRKSKEAGSVRSVRVLLVDDFQPFRALLRSILGKRPELVVVGEASNGLQATQKARKLRPDLILLDIVMPRLGGIDAAKRIREIAPHSAILFVSIEEDPDFVQAAMDAGARGYIPKRDVQSKLLPAIDALHLND